MLLVFAALSALLNLVILAALPFFFYFAWQKWRRKRSFKEIVRRAGLQLGETRYIGYSLGFTLAAVAILIIWPPPLEPLVREGSAMRSFAGLGFGVQTIVMALLYGVVKTGFTEELLFRGLIAGSLSRRLPLVWANVVQALIFLAPHLLILFIMPEMWVILPLVFVIALFKGWLRIKSGSIIGPWVIHGCVNMAMGISIAIRSVS